MLQHFFLQSDFFGLAITILLNGVPIVIDTTGDGYQETQPVNIWLKPGENKLSVQLDQVGNLEGGTTLGSVDSSAKIRLFRHREGSVRPDPVEVLANFSWPLIDTDIDIRKDQYEWSKTVVIPQGYIAETIQWSRSQSVGSLLIEDKQKIFQLLSRLALALQEKKFEHAFSMMKVKFQDEAVSNGKSLARVKSSVLELWQMMSDTPSLEMRLPSFEELQFHIVGRRNLIVVDWPGHESPIMFIDNEREIGYGIDLYFAIIDGAWVITR